jgi:hypothetical protein
VDVEADVVVEFSKLKIFFFGCFVELRLNLIKVYLHDKLDSLRSPTLMISLLNVFIDNASPVVPFFY